MILRFILDKSVFKYLHVFVFIQWYTYYTQIHVSPDIIGFSILLGEVDGILLFYKTVLKINSKTNEQNIDSFFYFKY